jgi:hypothetical protein
MADTLPPDWDWVTNQYACNADKMFHRLRLMAKSNVETRNGQVPDTAGFKETEEMFSVWRKRAHGRLATDFVLTDDGITVCRSDQADVVMTVSLDDHGVCKCKVGKDLLDPWQALKRMLEPMLFY